MTFSTGRVKSFSGISIHIPLAGDDGDLSTTAGAIGISIHIPLAGDDALEAVYSTEELVISIHIPLAGDDACKTIR